MYLKLIQWPKIELALSSHNPLHSRIHAERICTVNKVLLHCKHLQSNILQAPGEACWQPTREASHGRT